MTGSCGENLHLAAVLESPEMTGSCGENLHLAAVLESPACLEGRYIR